LEEAKIAIRNVRWDVLKDIKNAENNKEISEDEKKDLESKLQDSVNEANKKVDELFKTKETDIMKV
jgi:ribosome recycling factor